MIVVEFRRLYFITLLLKESWKRKFFVYKKGRERGGGCQSACIYICTLAGFMIFLYRFLTENFGWENTPVSVCFIAHPEIGDIKLKGLSLKSFPDLSLVKMGWKEKHL